ncbi:UDP-N-acetylmuramyl-tripeptide synthetase [Chloroherpeton thalassium ATCC 35110]|uniref:UDP-N-acetylmuramoyl-L-alanyl-D-glutamate--2,6-diaminopimelate ligase n=1 Tax=Chloroherpeton thalassium (strain ATCC 35110 / GB-78) TaxID=517418 RepID=B3QWT2_CHLT3|nr:UDP-N-acetylmuramoyl-L-alanyl-D-glutamate--2,6-diaminopimelate ligase [Chloroherpeton thalassium]ACF13296.1 UDP-N-acetylmuramyl-tripeptide synthetase [Chloroherpeton thalassium ATCC 35110]
MRLKDLINSIELVEIAGELHEDTPVGSICFDSRKVGPNAVFVAIRGFNTDGHQYINQAVEADAMAIVCEEIPKSWSSHQLFLKVWDSREALAKIAKRFYENASDELKVIGVTGTNGKTTTTGMIKCILDANEIKTGLIGTTGYIIGNQLYELDRTTPDALELHQLFHKMLEAGCRAVVMEVSSHALALKRTAGIRFDIAVFTNLTHDHLDFHGSMTAYADAKKLLFDNLSESAFAVINADDDYAEKMVKDCKANIVRCGVINAREKELENPIIDVMAKVFSYTINGTSAIIADDKNSMMHQFRTLGKFNMYNTVEAYAAGLAFGFDRIHIIRGLMKCPPVRGRMQQVWSKDHRCAIVDYSHTPDALENALQTICLVKPENGRIITLFGCGGDRDKEKRPLMGKIAEDNSDIIIITSDNPRSEDPEKILDDIQAGIHKQNNFYRIVDRETAIRKAITLLTRGDVALIAGKGHETYQEIAGKKFHFDDKEIIESVFREQEGLI